MNTLRFRPITFFVLALLALGATVAPIWTVAIIVLLFRLQRVILPVRILLFSVYLAFVVLTVLAGRL